MGEEGAWTVGSGWFRTGVKRRNVIVEREAERRGLRWGEVRDGSWKKTNCAESASRLRLHKLDPLG